MLVLTQLFSFKNAGHLFKLYLKVGDVNRLKKTLLFTDGACSGNPGPGGYGTVIVYPDGHVKELGGKRSETTNNRMEMMAIIKGLEESMGDFSDVLILTDSTYVIKGINEWIHGWKRKNWKNSEGNDVSNKDLWLELDRAVIKKKKSSQIEWGYVRGHKGIPGNERCDEIAVAFSKGKFTPLFDGRLLDYEIPIYDIPEDLSLPKKSSSSKDSRKGKIFIS